MAGAPAGHRQLSRPRRSIAALRRSHCMPGDARRVRRRRRSVVELQSALEERALQAVRDAKDELVGLTAELVACDTTARHPGDPARDEEKLQRLLAARLEALGAAPDLWEPEPTGAGDRFVPAGLDFVGRPQLAAVLPGSGGGRSILLNGHIDAVDVRAARAVAERPLRPHGAGRLPVRARRQRHEGRDRRPGHRPGGVAPPGRPSGRRRRLLHGHRRGVVGRRRPCGGRARRLRRRRHRRRGDRLRRLGQLPRHGDADDHRGRPRRPRRDAAAGLARRRRGQCDREARHRAQRGERAA